MSINTFTNSIMEEDDIELFTFLGDGGDLPPFTRSYHEIAALTNDLQENVARLDVLGAEIERSIERINNSLADEPNLSEALELQSPPSRLRRLPSMDNLAAIDCERIAESLAISFPNDPSIAVGWVFKSECTETNELQLPYRSASCQIR